MFRIRSIDSRHRAASFLSRSRRVDADDSARRAEATAAAAAGEGASVRGGWRRRVKGRKEERRSEGRCGVLEFWWTFSWSTQKTLVRQSVYKRVRRITRDNVFSSPQIELSSSSSPKDRPPMPSPTRCRPQMGSEECRPRGAPAPAVAAACGPPGASRGVPMVLHSNSRAPGPTH
jgi:hypothetical protein